jgi:hypothetical protein
VPQLRGSGNPDPALLTVPQHVIEVANSAPLIRYSRYRSGGDHTCGPCNGGWQIAMALAAWSVNTAADAKLLGQIHHCLQGANGISTK